MELKANGLVAIRRLLKLYDAELDEIRNHYRLSKIEITIIGFLHNNPGRDTAAEIAEIRMLPKGNVSQGVDGLIQKGLILRSRDEKDRRKIHLTLCESAEPVVGQIEDANRRYEEILYRGITEDELRLYHSVYRKIMKNADEELSGRLHLCSGKDSEQAPVKSGQVRQAEAQE